VGYIYIYIFHLQLEGCVYRERESDGEKYIKNILNYNYFRWKKFNEPSTRYINMNYILNYKYIYSKRFKSKLYMRYIYMR